MRLSFTIVVPVAGSSRMMAIDYVSRIATESETEVSGRTF
jgi:hypothetical protein